MWGMEKILLFGSKNQVMFSDVHYETELPNPVIYPVKSNGAIDLFLFPTLNITSFRAEYGFLSLCPENLTHA